MTPFSEWKITRRSTGMKSEHIVGMPRPRLTTQPSWSSAATRAAIRSRESRSFAMFFLSAWLTAWPLTPPPCGRTHPPTLHLPSRASPSHSRDERWLSPVCEGSSRSTRVLSLLGCRTLSPRVGPLGQRGALHVEDIVWADRDQPLHVDA